MKKCFLINNQILFFPEKNLLQRYDNPEVVVIFNKPSARCLEFILTNKNEFVSHNELYSAGWSNPEQEPTPNTLYQNILLIRKGFREISGSEINFVITMPRKGFYFNKDIAIEEVSHETYETAQPHSQIATIENAQVKGKISNRIPSHLLDNKILFFYWFFILISCVLIFYTVIFVDEDDNKFNNYVNVKNIGECKIFSDKDMEISIDDESINLSSEMIPCDKYPYRYITIYDGRDDFVFFLCKNDILTNNKNFCSSWHYQGEY